MRQLFADVPQALDNTIEIAEKVDFLDLAREVLLPAFPLPPGFDSQDAYLRHLTMWKVPCTTLLQTHYAPAIQSVWTLSCRSSRIPAILATFFIGRFPPLLLAKWASRLAQAVLVLRQDRRSLAVLELPNVDPIKYDLLFERFSTPSGVSMPRYRHRLSFDDVGRTNRSVDYVIDKYGRRPEWRKS